MPADCWVRLRRVNKKHRACTRALVVRGAVAISAHVQGRNRGVNTMIIVITVFMITVLLDLLLSRV